MGRSHCSIAGFDVATMNARFFSLACLLCCCPINAHSNTVPACAKAHKAWERRPKHTELAYNCVQACTGIPGWGAKLEQCQTRVNQKTESPRKAPKRSTKDRNKSGSRAKSTESRAHPHVLVATPVRPAMVRVPAGSLAKHVTNIETTVHVSSFWMAETEVTQAHYETLLGQNKAYFQNALFGGGPDHPIEQVTWVDAVHYCNALSAQEGLAPAYRVVGNQVVRINENHGYRLPTEVEWEYACRAQSDYAWAVSSDQLAALAWFDEQENGTTHRVRQRQPNGFGLYDLHGNVWEWCEDRFNTAKVADNHRALRGGSFSDEAQALSCVHRAGASADHGDYEVGFRPVRSIVGR